MKEVTLRESYAFYPTKQQERALVATFGCVRFIWNNYTSIFNSKETEKVYKTIKELKLSHPFLADVPYNALEQKLQDFKQFKSQYFSKTRKKKLGRPRFKSKKDSVQSFRLSSNGFKIRDGKLFLGKRLGFAKCKGSTSLDHLTNVTSVTVTRKSTGKYFISLCYKAFKKEKPKTGKSIGIDLGLTHFMIDDSGNKIENPRFLKNGLSKIRKAQKALSRKKKGSKRREKARIKLSLLHEKISNQRKHFLHNLSNKIVSDNDFIYVEDLAVANMVRNRRMARSIADASWSMFVSMLEYKSEWYGKLFHKIHRYFASSKTCSECGYQNESMDLSVREWECLDCVAVHDRDVNAAKNVLKRGAFEKEFSKENRPDE